MVMKPKEICNPGAATSTATSSNKFLFPEKNGQSQTYQIKMILVTHPVQINFYKAHSPWKLDLPRVQHQLHDGKSS